MSAKRVRSGATKRTEFWNVAVDRSNPAKGKRIIRKAAVRTSNGQFVGATNYPVNPARVIKGSLIEG